MDRTSSRYSLRHLIVVLAVVFAVFLPALKADFVQWDDDIHILNNLSIRSLNAEHLKQIFSSTVNDIYIPLTTLSFALEYKFFGFDPFVFHLDNILLHLGVVACVFFIALQLGLSVLGAAFAALLFGIHPLRVESVVWITERKDVLYALFYCLAILSYIKYIRSSGGKSSLWMAFALGVLSMLAKPMAISLPLIFFVLDWFFKRTNSLKDRILEKLPLFILLGALLWMTYTPQARLPDVQTGQAVLIWTWTCIFYIKQFFFPFILAPIYQLPTPLSWGDPEYLLSFFATIGLIGSAFCFRKYRWFLLAVFLYFFSIFFLLRFDTVQDTNIVADRFMYLPCLGLCFLIARGFEMLVIKYQQNDKRTLRIIGIAGLIILMIGSGWKTFNQSKVWNNTFSLWEHELKVYPNEPVALNNYAMATFDLPEYKRSAEAYRNIIKLRREDPSVQLSENAIEDIKRVEYVGVLLKEAIRNDPSFVDAYYNLGSVYENVGRPQDALEYYRKTLEMDPVNKEAFLGMGRVYVLLGGSEQAVGAFKKMLSIHPEDDNYFAAAAILKDALLSKPDDQFYKDGLIGILRDYEARINKDKKAGAFFNLGMLYSQLGMFDQAISAYKMVLELDPRDAGSFYNMGNIYKDAGELDKAAEYYQESLKYDNSNVNAYANLGVVTAKMGNVDGAIEVYQKAIKVLPREGRLQLSLGYLFETKGSTKESMEAYERSIELDPTNPEAYYNLGNIYTGLEFYDKALETYLKAVEYKPDHMNAWINLSIVAYKLGQYQAAAKYLDKATSLGYVPPEEFRLELQKYK